ncbi:dihydroorotate dehydrogenase (quinone) [Alicyclobacillus contaminans]|uniref:quinone-dependent dihydroorotate dehydrogenase n=1 Tax=Alicyclobacillus contaminans TaxID=392016 RepID=UPI0003FF9860|nr:quinone-dependent dihydroorotate dehydrogenase [Alicyclobacillus contaminans]GMA49570.1 dihydroorotate dehydrogenase (quinone) [Alicyclobacillus contaminans]
MYSWIRPLLFRLPPETAHRLTLHSLSRFPRLTDLAARSLPPAPELAQKLWNRTFPHPVGLAAGLDKDAVAVNGLLRCGFSFLEVGTVTPQPQPGNPTPRLFRLLEDEALINRMGFNNRGVDVVYQNLLKRKHPGIIGVNIGKNKWTVNEEAQTDYVTLVDRLYRVADYFTINVSSPNTPGLRDLQSEHHLLPLVQAVLQARKRQAALHEDRVRPHWVPVLVKLAPDLPNEQLAALAVQLQAAGVDGLIATNTTVARGGLTSAYQRETGGLSGRPLRRRSTEVISLLYRATDGRLPIIGSGGIFDADDAYEKIQAGASLIQVYTGFIYRGPALVGDIVRGLQQRLAAEGFANIAEAVGSKVHA